MFKKLKETLARQQLSSFKRVVSYNQSELLGNLCKGQHRLLTVVGFVLIREHTGKHAKIFNLLNLVLLCLLKECRRLLKIRLLLLHDCCSHRHHHLLLLLPVHIQMLLELLIVLRLLIEPCVLGPVDVRCPFRLVTGLVVWVLLLLSNRCLV